MREGGWEGETEGVGKGEGRRVFGNSRTEMEEDFLLSISATVAASDIVLYSSRSLMQ